MADSLIPNSSGLVRAIEAAMGAPIDALDAAAIARAKDPLACPADLLPFLAFEYSVDLWRDEWPEWKRRDVVARAFLDHRLKGTEAGARRYLEIAGAELVQVVAPPQHFFAAPDLSREQWDDWIATMPQVRVTLAHGSGEWPPPVGIFLGASALDADHLWINDGPALHGRRAWLRVPGQPDAEIDLLAVEGAHGATLTVERVRLPGRAGDALVPGAGALGEAFIGAEEIAPRTHSYSLDRGYRHEDSGVPLTSIPAGLEPRDTRYLRVSDSGDAGARLFLDDPAGGETFLGRNDGGELLADIIHLLDPRAAAPTVDALGALGVSRLGMDPYTADLLVHAPGLLPGQTGLAIADGYLGECAVMEADQPPIDRACEALAAAKAARDRLRIAFGKYRPRTPDDPIPLDAAVPLGGFVATHL